MKPKAILHIKVGDKVKGWIPGTDGINGMDAIRKQLHEEGIDKDYNILITHYAVELDVITLDQSGIAGE